MNTTDKVTDREAIRIIRDLLNDYGIRASAGISGDTAEAIEDWLTSTAAKGVALAVAQEQASYAMRYRFGEDLETLQRTVANIARIDPENF